MAVTGAGSRVLGTDRRAVGKLARSMMARA
jgi:hypothetical protein